MITGRIVIIPFLHGKLTASSYSCQVVRSIGSPVKEALSNGCSLPRTSEIRGVRWVST